MNGYRMTPQQKSRPSAPQRSRSRLTSPVSLILVSLLLAGCGGGAQQASRPVHYVSEQTVAMYAAQPDGDMTIPAVNPAWLSDDKVRREVDYWSDEKPGTIIVDPWARYVYYILGDNRAIRYTAAVGKEGRGFAGTAYIPMKREWPRWTPTANMIKREPEVYEPLRGGMEGGLDNPLGARALYLYRNGRDTLYRIHGTPYPWTIGTADSSGCIRLYNQDSRDLYDRVETGAKVIVLRRDQFGRGTVPPGTPLPTPPADDLSVAAPEATADTEAGIEAGI